MSSSSTSDTSEFHWSKKQTNIIRQYLSNLGDRSLERHHGKRLLDQDVLLNLIRELNSEGGKHATAKNVMTKIDNLKRAKQANLEQMKTSSTAKASASSAGEAHGVDQDGVGSVDSALSSLSGSLLDHQPPQTARRYLICGQTYTGDETVGVLGTGAFGIVLKVTDTDNKEYAVKEVHFTISHPETRNGIMQEAQILVGLSHPNVLECHGFAFFPGGHHRSEILAIVMPLCPQNLQQRFVFALLRVSHTDVADLSVLVS